MRLITLAMLSALAGCSGVFSPYPNATAPPPGTRYLVVVDFDLSKCPQGAEACAKWAGNICHVHLPRERWSECAVHELGHCFNGDWHRKEPVPCEVF